MRRSRWLGWLLFFGCGIGAWAIPAQADWPALQGLVQGGARVSALAVDLGDDAVIAQLDREQRLTPASVTKLVVSAAALNTWAADRIFQTRLYATAPVRDGRIEGDLILRGAGDPSLTNEALWAIGAQLKGAGVRSVSGRLIVTPAPFPSVPCETQDRCDALARSDTAYNAPLAAVGVDFGTWCVDVRATTVGAPALVTGCSAARLPIAVQGTVQTDRAGRDPTLWVERVTTNGIDTLRVGGAIAAGKGQRVYRAMSNPALGAGLLLKESLHEIGIEVDGAVSLRDGDLPAGAYAIGQAEGLALKEQLGRMLRFSNNYIADVLTLTMASEIGNRPVPTLAEAGRTLSNFLAQTHRRSRRGYVPPTLRSGSGLTPENALSADDLVDLLSYEFHDSRDFGPFYGGLVVPRQAPFVFLRNGSPAWLDRVALKTGTMNDPRSVCAVAGYLRKKNGGWIAFAILVNGSERSKHVPLYKAMEAIRKDVDQILARY